MGTARRGVSACRARETTKFFDQKGRLVSSNRPQLNCFVIHLNFLVEGCSQAGRGLCGVTSLPISGRFKTRGKVAFRQSPRGAWRSNEEVKIFRRTDRARAAISRVHRRGVKLDYTRPGKPTDNGLIESFNGRLRDESLNVHEFVTMQDAREKLRAWQHDYNHHRPHGSLGHLTPSEFVKRRSVQQVESSPTPV